jgi:amino acid transporter
MPELKRVIGPKLLLLFIVGDILGTGVYALTGRIAGEVGGAAWAPLLLAFAVATMTGFSYLELVTKYPQAAGAALYAHKAFGIHFLTFLVTFAVLSSGITSASTASKFLAENFIVGFHLDWDQRGVTGIALGFMALLALVNLRGVGESLKFNVVLTLVELTGLLIVIFIGAWAMTQGNVDFSRVTVFETAEGKGVFLSLTAATTLAFFSMVGFEDSVNMAEETKDPVRTFPKVMLTGLGITAVIYVLVSIFAVAVVPIGTVTNVMGA